MIENTESIFLPENSENLLFINSNIFKISLNNSIFKKIKETDFHSQKTLNQSKSRIPLLEEVFKRYPDLWINLDVKIDNDELIKKVIKSLVILIDNKLNFILYYYKLMIIQR